LGIYQGLAMTLEADSLSERRRMKRRLRFWRTGAIIVAVIAAIGLAMSQNKDFATGFGLQSYVARVTISGIIADDREQLKLLKEISENAQVRGVILNIDSPGGTTAGAEALYLALRSLAEKKPVVAVFGTAATSAAYLAGIAADHIVARGNSITGSVGVILQYAEFSEMLNKLGIRVEEVRSGPLKAVPSPFTPPNPDSRALVEELITESREWFVNIVTERRKIDPANIEQIRTGRIYTGRQAIKIGLIDEIGDEETALKYLREKRGLPEKIEVVDRKAEEASSGFWMSSLARWAGGFFGGAMEPVLRAIADGPQLNQLDGLVSLWHPQNQ
jgi:protease-4